MKKTNQIQNSCMIHMKLTHDLSLLKTSSEAPSLGELISPGQNSVKRMMMDIRQSILKWKKVSLCLLMLTSISKV